MQAPLEAAAGMVVKDGLRPAQLDADARTLALAIVWAGLAAPGPWNEREVTARLRALLAGAASFLDTDPVELRRWLVDFGWLQRDGWGREYRRTAAQRLPLAQAALAEQIDTLDIGTWAAAQRRRHAAGREARRRAWDERQAPLSAQ